MSKVVTKIPKLRFREFGGAWKEKRFKDFTKRVSKKFDPRQTNTAPLTVELDNLETGTGRLVGAGKLCDQQSLKSHFIENDILFGKLRPYLRKYWLADQVGVCSSEIWVLRADQAEPRYVYCLVQTSKFQEFANQSSGSKMPRADWAVVGDILFALPSLPEQEKIADLLEAVDARVGLLRRRRDALTTYKKGMMQRLFSQQIRFTREDGSAFPDWQVKRLGEVFDRVTRKNDRNSTNVLTISAQQGLISQQEFFNKSVSASDVTGYYLLHRNDFAYNKSYSKGYPMGAIKRLKRYDVGVVSTLYICFAAKQVENSNFFEHYFDSGRLNRELHKIAQEGARNHGLLNMSVIEFFRDIEIPCPHPEEQQKIADSLSALDDKVTAVTRQITAMQAFKKALLQQMFV